MDITHVVGTRFNIGKGTNADWTKYRGQLLRRFAAKSVQMQAKAPALWVVLVDARTPDDVLNPIIEGLPCTIFKTNKWPGGWAGDLADWLRERVKTEWMSFTRLDSDDALHPLYIADIAKAVRPRREILTFRGGLVVRVERMEAHRLMKTNTSFQTTVEQTAKAKTGYCAGHGKLPTLFPTHVLQSFPRWLVVRHERNERHTGKYPFPRAHPGELKANFGFLFR